MIISKAILKPTIALYTRNNPFNKGLKGPIRSTYNSR